MSEPIFPILGTEDVPMVGREDLMDRLWRDLTKATPSNLSIVGPRYIGKTVLLKSLAERARQADSPYSLVVHWELGYAPPQSDVEFVAALCDLLHSEMGADANTYREHRNELAADKSFGVLKEVMDLLQMEDKSVLMIWDGFDKPLSQGLLSGLLFGQLRDLFYGKTHKLVTATRATQTELARNKQVEDSPFWNMFDVNPVRVGPFGENDHTAALKKAGLTVSQGGAKELSNWAAGHPVILLSILNELASCGTDERDHNDVNEAAGKAAVNLSNLLDVFWNTCNSDVKSVFCMLAEKGELAADTVGKDETKFLVAQGFARRDGTKLKSSCRLLTNHVKGARPDAGAVGRLFASWESYRSEIGHVLEWRLKHIERPVNARLHKLVRSSISQILDEPDLALAALSYIEDQALDVIWEFECGTDKTVPQSVVSYWTQPPRDDDNIIKEMMSANDWTVPFDRYRQIALLQRLTGSRMGFDPKAKAVSKDVYVLLNAIHSFRNRSQHSGGQRVHEGVAVSAIMTCVELLNCLSREFSS